MIDINCENLCNCFEVLPNYIIYLNETVVSVMNDGACKIDVSLCYTEKSSMSMTDDCDFASSCS